MQLFIDQTEIHKAFFAHIRDQTRLFYKNKIQLFNSSGDLDHSLTNNIFNMITTEINTLKDLFPSIIRVYNDLQEGIINQKKFIVSERYEQSKNYLMRKMNSNPLIFDKYFNKRIKKLQNDYDYLLNKFTIMMDKLKACMGLYEELYLVNLFSLSFGPNYSLNYKDSNYIIANSHSKISFKIIPIFFFMKFVLQQNNDRFINKLILEKILETNFTRSNFLLTISDQEQIDSFQTFCNMNYLSEFLLNKIYKGESYQLPKIINFNNLKI